MNDDRMLADHRRVRRGAPIGAATIALDAARVMSLDELFGKQSDASPRRSSATSR